MFLKVFLKLKQITKDERCSCCNGELKKTFVNILPLLPPDNYTLFDLAESNQFKFIFTVNHGTNCLSSPIIQQNSTKVFTELRLLYPYFTVFFGSKITIYCLNFADIWTILQGSSGNSTFHKVYSEVHVWLFDNINFHKIHFLTQKGGIIKWGYGQVWEMEKCSGRKVSEGECCSLLIL